MNLCKTLIHHSVYITDGAGGIGPVVQAADEVCSLAKTLHDVKYTAAQCTVISALRLIFQSLFRDCAVSHWMLL